MAGIRQLRADSRKLIAVICTFSSTRITTSSAGASTRSCCRGPSSSPASSQSGPKAFQKASSLPAARSSSRGSIDRCRCSRCQALDKNFPGGGQNTIVQVYGDPSQNQVMVRVPTIGAESGQSLSTIANQVDEALKKGGIGTPERVGTEIVGPTVGAELKRRGIR